MSVPRVTQPAAPAQVTHRTGLATTVIADLSALRARSTRLAR